MGSLFFFSFQVKEVIRSACRTALLEQGFTPDDYFNDPETDADMIPGTASSFMHTELAEAGDSQEKMTYTEQANKRAHCRRFTKLVMKLVTLGNISMAVWFFQKILFFHLFFPSL